MSNRQPLLIQELANPGALLVFDGKNRVEPKVAVPMRRRTRQTWQPGNDRATVHDMGVAYDPIVIRTRWHDDFFRLIGETPEILLQQARGMCLRGNQCRLSWGDSIVRLGRVKRVDPEYVRSDDIIVKITFEVDAAEEQGLYVYRTPPAVARAAQLRDLANRAIEVFSIASFTVSAAYDIATSAQRSRDFDTDVDALTALEEERTEGGTFRGGGGGLVGF